jgi:hypothetical protein
MHIRQEYLPIKIAELEKQVEGMRNCHNCEHIGCKGSNYKDCAMDCTNWSKWQPKSKNESGD